VKVKVNFLAVLRGLAGKGSVEVEVHRGLSIRDVIYLACKDNEALFKRVFDPDGKRIRSDIIVLADGVDVNLIGGLDSSVDGFNEITMIPSVHGGSATSIITERARKLLALLMSEKDKVDLRTLYIRLKEEMPSQKVIRFLENTFEGPDIVWAASRPGLVLSQLHVFLVFYHTIKAFALRKNISNKFNIEFLLRLVCEDQIVRALEIAGMGDRVREFYLYVMSSSREVFEEKFRSLLSLPVEEIEQLNIYQSCEATPLLKILNISEEELHATSYKSSTLGPDLKSVLTRMSLLNARK